MKKIKLTLSMLMASLLALGAFACPVMYANEMSVLERVRKVEDPELAELIRIALENIPASKLIMDETNPGSQRSLTKELELEKPKTIRIVTATYAQVKLLDKKIGQIDKKLEKSSPQEIELELLLAKAALECEQLKAMAELRYAMNIVPRSSWGEIPDSDLNTWLHLEIYEDAVRVFQFTKPFDGTTISRLEGHDEFRSFEEVSKYIDKILNEENTFPIRLSFSSTTKGKVLAEAIQNKIKAITESTQKKYKVDLTTNYPLSNNDKYLHLADNRIHIDKIPSANPYTMEQYISSLKKELNRAGSLPLTLNIFPHDDTCEAMIKQLQLYIEDTNLDYAVQIHISN